MATSSRTRSGARGVAGLATSPRIVPGARGLAALALAALLGLATPLAAPAAASPHRGALAYLSEPRRLDASALDVGGGAPPAALLADDGRRAIAVIGQPAGAQHVAVLVPGMGRNRANFGVQAPAKGAGRALDIGQMQRGNALYQAMAASGEKVAVVVFQGYLPPQGDEPLAAIGTRAAGPGIGELGTVTRIVRTAAPGVHVTWVCHSYGSLVCAGAHTQLRDGDDIVFIGSPGTGLRRAEELAPARTWAGLGARDPIAFVGLARDLGISPFGPLPTDPDFGARALDAANAGHSDYFRPGSPALVALSAIALGRGVEQPSAADVSAGAA